MPATKKARYYEARLIDKPTKVKGEWTLLQDEDGTPVRGTNLGEVRRRANKVCPSDPRLVIAKVEVEYLFA